MVINCSLLGLQSSVGMITSVYIWLADDIGEGEHLLCLGVMLWLEINEVFKLIMSLTTLAVIVINSQP